MKPEQWHHTATSSKAKSKLMKSEITLPREMRLDWRVVFFYTLKVAVVFVSKGWLPVVKLLPACVVLRSYFYNLVAESF